MNRRDVIRLLGALPATIPAVAKVEELHLEPKDVLVLSFEEHLSVNVIEELQAYFKEVHGGIFKDTPIMILTGGAKLQLLKKTT